MGLSFEQEHEINHLTNFFKNHEFGAFVTMSVSLAVVGFLGLALVPTYTPEDSYAVGADAEMEVGVNPVASIALEYYDPSTSAYVASSNLDITINPGAFKTGATRITTSTNSPGGMKLSMSDNDSNNALVEQNDSQSSPAKPVISSITSNKTIADVVDSGKAFSDDTWGYAIVDTTPGSTSAPAVPLTYSQIPTTETQLKETDAQGDAAYIFTSGVRVSQALPAGTYKDQLTFTVIANPLPAPAFFTTEYMQDFSQTICASVQTPSTNLTAITASDGSDYDDSVTKVPSTTIKDKRDEQVYTIRKLADGNCWMTDNLAFGANGGTITADNTDNPAKTSLSDYNITSDPSDFTESYDVARILTTDATKVDGTDSFTSYDYNGNASGTITSIGNSGSKLGAMYNFCAATGGTACTTSGTKPTVSGSICPKGWTLPTFANEIDTSTPTTKPDKSYERMLGLYGVTNNAAGARKLKAPLNFVRAGYANSGELYSRYAEGVGDYWSASPLSSVAYAHNLRFHSSAAYNDYSRRHLGFSIRCVSS